jgi:hypothetical protein
MLPTSLRGTLSICTSAQTKKSSQEISLGSSYSSSNSSARGFMFGVPLVANAGVYIATFLNKATSSRKVFPHCNYVRRSLRKSAGCYTTASC